MGRKNGFTIIEILLFLAIAGALVAGIIASTVAPISRQRYNTGVDIFVDFLEGIYSSVTSVQNVSGSGRSDIIVYGKLVTYGEPDDMEYGEGYTFHIYDIVGDVYTPSKFSFDNTLSAIKNLNGCIFAPIIDTSKSKGEINFCKPESDGTNIRFANETIFTSALSIENGSSGHIPASGAFMIVRSPSSGVVNTYTTTGYDSTTDNFWNKDGGFATPSEALENSAIAKNYLKSLIDGHLKTANINFCLYSDDMHYATSFRRNVRITAGANNSSGIKLIATDDSDDSTGGNICRN